MPVTHRWCAANDESRWGERTVHGKKTIRRVYVFAALVAVTPSGVAEHPTIWAEAAGTYGLDPVVLYAVALQESRTLRPDGVARPWPWTLRSSRDGPQSYENLDDARAALEALLADGERNVDIGLMQVNWGMNGYRAERASDLLIPRHNVMVGARILRDAMVVHDGDLAKALEDYHHRPDSERGQRYSAEVRRRLEKLRAVPGITRALSGGASAK